MNRQSKAIITAVGLMLALLVVGWQNPVPYVRLTPGVTVNVLGDYDGQPVIQVNGARQYPDNGNLRMVTVYVTRASSSVSLPEAMWTWVTNGGEILPYDVIYPPNTSQSQESARSSAQMVSSQDNAIAAALTALGYDLTTRVGVAGVIPESPSDGVLRARDWILAIDGETVTRPRQVVTIINQHAPGDVVALRIERDGKELTKKVTLGERPDAAGKPLLGVYPGIGYDFPFDVNVNIDPNIGGPSAGLVLALAIYDNLTPGSLLGDVHVAGTGTISSDGRVGPIGGIAEKIKAAARDGADLFLVPADNCADALAAHTSDEPRLVKAENFDSALTAIKDYVKDPNAPLPECTP